jgi:DNA-binding YbaB/EbfC family protein
MMFKGIGDLFGMLKNLPKLKAQMEEFQQKLGQITAEASSGGGMVTARANGRMELLGVTLSDEATKLNDKEMLEDLIAAAVNQALAKVRQQVAEETQKVAGGLGLPPGMGLPGLS